MRLNTLKNRTGSTHRRVRVGRGIGSGCGKTACRGVKGQKSRSGVRVKGFEGGQTPIYRRLPKRGFRPFCAEKFATVRLGHIQALVEKGFITSKSPITYEDCIAYGLASRSQKGIRIVAGGELKSPVIIEACGISSSARVALEKIGGQIILPVM